MVRIAEPLPYVDVNDGDNEGLGDPEWDVPTLEYAPHTNDLDAAFFARNGWPLPDEGPHAMTHDDVPVSFDGYPDGYWDQRGEG